MVFSVLLEAVEAVEAVEAENVWAFPAALVVPLELVHHYDVH